MMNLDFLEICHQTQLFWLPDWPYVSLLPTTSLVLGLILRPIRCNILIGILLWTLPGPCLGSLSGALYCMQWTFPKWATSRQWSDWRDHHVPYSATVLDICCLTAAEIYIISWVDTNHACSAHLSKFPTYRLLGLCQCSCRRDEKGVLVSVRVPGGSVRTPELCSWDVRDVLVGSWWICPWILQSFNT